MFKMLVDNNVIKPENTNTSSISTVSSMESNEQLNFSKSGNFGINAKGLSGNMFNESNMHDQDSDYINFD
jgi:hypothetical protein